MRARSSALMQGVRWVNLRARSSAPNARSAVGHQSASTVVGALMQGVRGGQSASTVVAPVQECGGSQIASTVVALSCKECGGGSICEHGRQRSHARSAVGDQSASTVVYALIARSAVGHKYASTVVIALSARSAVGHKSASTVVSASDARSAVGHKYASTVVGALMQGVRWGINLRARSSALQV